MVGSRSRSHSHRRCCEASCLTCRHNICILLRWAWNQCSQWRFSVDMVYRICQCWTMTLIDFIIRYVIKELFLSKNCSSLRKRPAGICSSWSKRRVHKARTPVEFSTCASLTKRSDCTALPNCPHLLWSHLVVGICHDASEALRLCSAC